MMYKYKFILCWCIVSAAAQPDPRLLPLTEAKKEQKAVVYNHIAIIKTEHTLSSCVTHVAKWAALCAVCTLVWPFCVKTMFEIGYDGGFKLAQT